MQIVVTLILVALYLLGWLLVIVVGGLAALFEQIMKNRASKRNRFGKKKSPVIPQIKPTDKGKGVVPDSQPPVQNSEALTVQEEDAEGIHFTDTIQPQEGDTDDPGGKGLKEPEATEHRPTGIDRHTHITRNKGTSPEYPNDDSGQAVQPAPAKPTAVKKELEAEQPTYELSLFNNLIYHIKLIGHEDTRFQLVSIKAYELITQFAESNCFFTDILRHTTNDSDFATEVIRFIISHKRLGISDADIIRKLRKEYLVGTESNNPRQSVGFTAKPKTDSTPNYIESDTNPGSRQLTAKSKIAHKHRAIQYANVIGNKLAEGFVKSGEKSFHEYIRKQCKGIAAKGDSSITTEDFEPQRQYILTYKKSNKRHRTRTVATSVVTPKKDNPDRQIDAMLNILNRLTSSRLPRYEVAGNPSMDSIIQREYKKTSPFEVYNDLVLSEYTSGALSDRRFSVLYQLIIFISDCLENGMSEDETLNALSSLRVVRKRDLNILREREIRFKGLSKEERDLILDSEICNNLDMTRLYTELIRQYKKRSQPVSMNAYIFTVLMKSYKDSATAWRLLKYIYLKESGKSSKEIASNRYAVLESYHNSDDIHSTRGSTEVYFTLERSFKQLKYEYDRNVDMTRYNFDRDNVTTDMLNIQTLMQYLPKRFDGRKRLCSPVMMTPIEANLFTDCETRIISDRVYVMVPIPALSTKDLYSLLLTVIKQKRKIEKSWKYL